MDETLYEPVELIDSDLDEVAGGYQHRSVDIDIGNFVTQVNASLNQVSVGNNNNGVSGNQVVS
jgi:hypothetical protein